MSLEIHLAQGEMWSLLSKYIVYSGNRILDVHQNFLEGDKLVIQTVKCYD